ncbi:MAG: carbohydrate kinase family protein [bacterium]|nr:carbohydrate kinase family protein [bacterium]
MNLLVSGSIAYDKIMDFPGKFSDHILPNKIHNINVSFGIEKMNVQYGGTAGNIAYNLALLNEKPFVISQVGSDFTEYKKWFKQHGVNLSLVRTVKNETCSTAHVITDKANNQITGFHFGAMQQPAIKDAKVWKDIKQKAVSGKAIGLLSPGNVDDMMALAKLYQKQNVPYIFDPGQQTVWLTADQIRTILKGASVLILNDYELAMVEKKLHTTAKKLRNKLHRLIVTLGEKGAIWYVGDMEYKMPVAKPEKVVDPTGAGDAYRAGLVVGMVNNWDDELSGRVAALCATYAIEHYGTQQHLYLIAKFKQRFEKTFGKKFKLELKK